MIAISFLVDLVVSAKEKSWVKKLKARLAERCANKDLGRPAIFLNTKLDFSLTKCWTKTVKTNKYYWKEL